MKRSYILLILNLLSASFIINGQESLDSLIAVVRQNNKELIAADKYYQLEIENSKTGLNPEDPEIELGYLYGDPASLGNRTDFSISQRFDFPSAYIHRRKLAKVEKSTAVVKLQITTQEIVTKAKKIWIEKVFYNQQQLIMSKRLAEAENLEKQYQRKLATGELNQIQANKVSLHTSLLRNEYDKIVLEQHKINYAIIELCGGKNLQINDSTFFTSNILNPDTIIERYKNSPEKAMMVQTVDLKNQEKKLIESKNLPRINLGYYSESIVNEKFKGFKIGLSIPLWENKNTVKKAKAEIIFAEADLQYFENFQMSKVEQFLERRKHLMTQIFELSNSLNKIEDLRLLTKALQAGEISLSEYYYETDFYFRSQIRLLEMQKEQLEIEIDLMKVFN